MRNIISLALLLIFLLLAGCELNTSNDVSREKNHGFETESLGNIFYDKCATSGCHSSRNPVNGLSLASHTELFEGSFDRPVPGTSIYGGDVVIPYSVSKSLLYQFITGNIDTKLDVDHLMLTGSEVLEIKEWIEDGAKDYKQEVPFSVPNPYRVYVCNRGSDLVSVIDGRQKVVSRVVDVGPDDDSTQIPVQIKERGDFYYVTSAKAGKFIKIRKSDNEIVAEIDNLIFPGDFVLMESTNKAYIARSLLSTGLYNSIYVVNFNTMTFIREVTFTQAGLPVGVALNLLETFLFVSDNVNNVIYGVNTATDNTGEFAPIIFAFNFRPTYLKMDPLGNYLYMSAPGTNELVVIDLTSRLTTSIISVGANPRHIAVKSDASKIYVTCMDANGVDVINRIVNSWTWSRRITNPAFSMLDGIDITKDDGLLYITGRNSEGDFEVPYPVKSEKTPGIVGIISVANESVIKVIEVERQPGGIATE